MTDIENHLRWGGALRAGMPLQNNPEPWSYHPAQGWRAIVSRLLRRIVNGD